ncbi:discoidin domain-containing protein [Paenibacillus phytorum]|uniref:discoidin domain-containing protein n=1 Tax=Paenibacillus phytorum TaxID=2654977 RepID=UPI001491AB7F|nr:discoidin domain-containing protein [Paenibacillus phytorum]
MNFNNNWGFYLGDLTGAEAPAFDDSKFANITIPHTMRLEKKHANGAQSVYQGIGWYRNYFTVDEQYRGKTINIDFEGVMIDSDIYLNGEKVYTRNGGYVGFSVDITNKVKYGQTNVLAVRVSSFDNPDTPPGKPDAGLDFHYFGGIYRDVKMRITNNLHISDALQADKTASGGVFVTYPQVTSSSATVNVKTHVVNADTVSAQAKVISKLVDKNGNVVAQGETDPTSIAASGDYQFNQNLTVTNPSLWSPDSPYLYSLVSEVYNASSLVDSTTTKVGVRTIQYKPDGLYINGQKIFIRGANRHQQYQNIGDAASDSMQYRDALLMKEDGFNAVRAAHYPNDPAFLDAADEIGLLVVECQPGWQNWTNTTKFYDLTLRDTREMIRRDRNRPSVVLWEAALNETPTAPATWNQAVTQIAHAEYPGNQMYTANDYGLHGEYYDVNYKGVDTNWQADPSKWTDFAPNKAFLTREWGDWGDGSRALRAQGEAAVTSALLNRQRMLNGDGYSDWGGMDANARIGGYFMWVWNDHTRGSNSVTAGAGTVDIDRYEKYGYYWLQSMQSARNPVYGPMVFIGSTYSSTSSLNVNVFSNADSVKLYQNNVLVKEITRAQASTDVPNTVAKGGSPIFKFTLPQFVAGELRADAILDGQVVKTHTVKTPGQANKLEIEVRDRGRKPVADGSDLIPVYFKVVDANGTVVPNALNTIHIDVTGQGQLVGKGMPRIGVEDQTVEAGIGFAFVRASDISGDIQITATSEGLTSATTTVSTLPYQGQFVSVAQHIPWVGGVEKFEPKDSFYKNIAVGKPITASSEQPGNPPKNAVDNSESTRWCADGSSLPQWLQVDLGKTYSLQGFQMLWEKSDAVYKYYIEVSKDGVNWTKVIDKSTNTSKNGKETALADTRGRYVRLSVVGSITNNYWACLYEFKVIPSDEQIPDDIITDSAIDSITASSETEDGRGTDKLRDGDTNIGTGWLAKSNEMPQSVTVKFKTPQTIAGSRIFWEKDSNWYTYDLEVSTDGVVWRKAIDNYQVGGQHFTPEAFAKPFKNINYVRVTIKDISAGGGFRVGFAELILYGQNYTIPSDYGITAIKPLTVNTNQGIAPSLPTKVTAVYNDESEQAVAVVWDSIEAASYANVGEFTVQGTVSGTSIKATAQVTVEPSVVPVVPQTVITGAEKVNSGQTFNLTIGLTGVTQSVNQQVYAQDLTLQYDPASVQFDSVTSLKDGFQVIDQKETAPGHIRIVAASVGANVPAQGDLLTIKFTAKSVTEATNTTISVDHVKIANAQGNELQVGGASREIQITVPTIPVDKSLLNATIASAQAKYDAAVEGNGDGLYAIGSKAQLQSAIDAAKSAANNSNATQLQVDSAKVALEAAVQVFESKKITADINGGGVSIGDLASVAAAYGKQQGQAGWNEKADVNHDGKVDIVDLAIVAKAILN